MKNQKLALARQRFEVRHLPVPPKFFTYKDSLIKVFCFMLLMVLPSASGTAGTNQFLVFHRQASRSLPKLLLGQQTYLPVVDLLNFLDLPYSESSSAGFIQITVSKSRLRMTKDQAQVVLNEKVIALSAPVTLVKNQWVVPTDFISKALARVLEQRVAMATSGNAVAVGEPGFTRLTAKVMDKDKVLRVQASRPVAAEVRQHGSRVVLAFGNTPVDLVGLEGVQQATWIRAVTFDQAESTNQIVIELSDGVRSAKISHLASQNSYIVEAIRLEGPEPNPSAVLGPPVIAAWKWRHITIDAGHGGHDRGVAIRENVFEKDVALAIARKLRWSLEKRLGVEVVLSRADDQARSLEDRIVAANRARSSLFISIHTGNAPGSATAHSFAYTTRWIAAGTSAGETRSAQTLFVPWWEAQRGSLAWSERLAECVQTEMNRALNGGRDLAFRRSPIKLLSALAMPAVLVEIGNARVPDFQAKVYSEPFQNLVAATLAAAVEKFRPLHERP